MCICTYTMSNVSDTAQAMLDRCLFQRTRAAARAVTRFYDDELRSTGLRATQASVLATVAAKGEELVAVRGRQVRAERHRITAPELTIDLWFAGEQWVALEAPAKGGRRLRYELM